MPLNCGQVQISREGGLNFRELKHEVSSKQNECVMVCSLESRDVIGAEENIECCKFSSEMPSPTSVNKPRHTIRPDTFSSESDRFKIRITGARGNGLIDDVSKIQNFPAVS